MTPVVDTLTYVDRWSERWPSEFEELDEDEARRRHETGELYTVLLGDPEAPHAYLEVRLEAGFVGVYFLDDDRCNYLTYLFSRDDGEDSLFLGQAIERSFDESGNVRQGKAFTFKRDGKIYLEEKDYETREAWRGEKQDDVGGNWEPIPEFGRYESIARVER